MSESFLTDLRALIDVDASSGTRARYSSDAGLTRIPPLAVAFPRTPEQAIAAFDLARAHGVPLTARGGGTSCASNAIGPGLVLDFSRHMNRVISIDPEARTATVEPGCVGSTLQAAAAKHGLRFGPDPPSQNRATIAGMVANNACGPHATAWGRTSDNIVSLDCVDGQGRRFTATTSHETTLSDVPGLASLIDSNLAPIRTELGRFKRQVSGYSLEHLTPEGGRNLAAMLAGTEGTLVLILSITVRLVPLPDAPVLAALGYRSMIDAADDVPALLAHSPLAVEGMDRRLVDVVRAHKGPGAVPAMPDGEGWLLVEVGAPGEDVTASLERARALCADSAAIDTVVYPPGAQASALWRIRADGAGLGGRTPPDGAGGGDQQAWPGFEDAAVPPENLGAYLRDFTALMEEFDIDGLLYGHFGDGCVHVRLAMPLETPEGVAHSRAFLQSAARICAAHGGSVSGEHGDGRARGELLRFMYSPEMLDLFARVKHVFDPDNLLNPGVLAAPMDEAEATSRARARNAGVAGVSGTAGNSGGALELQPGVDPLDYGLRRVSARPMPADGGFAFTHDGGDFTAAVHRCTGVGKCRAGVSGTFRRPRTRSWSRPSTPPRSLRPSTCAWPAKPAPPTAPPASTWPATAPKRSSAPTGDASAPSATTRSAGCRASPASPRACPAWPPSQTPSCRWHPCVRSPSASSDSILAEACPPSSPAPSPRGLAATPCWQVLSRRSHLTTLSLPALRVPMPPPMPASARGPQPRRWRTPRS